MKTFILKLLLSSALLAECTFYSDGSIDVTWEAYATPLKTAVNGTFLGLYTKQRRADSLEALLMHQSLYLQQRSVLSHHGERDAKLVQFFFNLLVGQTIKARIMSVTKEILSIEVVMNSQSVTIPMTYKNEGSVIVATGVLDLYDFKANEALDALTQSALNDTASKIWNDVAIRFEMPFEEHCE